MMNGGAIRPMHPGPLKLMTWLVVLSLLVILPNAAAQEPFELARVQLYLALGIPRAAVWYDATNRPYHVQQAAPIRRLTA